MSEHGEGKRDSIQEIQRTALKINKNRSTPRHIITKLANLRDKEKILKAALDKRFLNYRGRSIRLAADLPTETRQARKDWHDIFRVLNEKKCNQEYFIQQGCHSEWKER